MGEDGLILEQCRSLWFRAHEAPLSLSVLPRSERLVEGDGVAQEGVDDVGVVVELLVHHEGEDAHLGTAVVELDRLLAKGGG